MKDNYLSVNNISVVIADDEDGVRAVIKDYLNHDKFAIAGEATDGKEALELYNQLKPSIVLLDMEMPLYKGNIALLNILFYDPSAKIIAMTCSGNLDSIIDFVQTGACNYIIKPFKQEELMQVITETIKGYHKQTIYNRLEGELKGLAK